WYVSRARVWVGFIWVICGWFWRLNMSSYRISLLVVLMTFSAFMVFAEPRPYFTEPSLSPDRKEIAFVSGGDIWTVPATGGVASLLVSHAANEGRPLYLKRETAKAAPSARSKYTSISTA